jgi:hypothetical protein
MDAHEYVFVFQNLNILCIFSDRFFSGFRFRFLGSTGSVLVTLFRTHSHILTLLLQRGRY